MSGQKFYHNFFEVKTLIESYGYKSETKIEFGCTYHKRFIKGVRNIWETRRGYQSADLINGKYTNHQEFSELTDALERPLTQLGK